MSKFIPASKIDAEATDFLKQYHPSRNIPIPIEEILDLKLRINIVPMPNLFNDHKIDSFLSLDLKDLYIDQTQIEKWENRSRFTFAHEAGYLVLHKSYLQSLNINTIEKWKCVVLGKGSGHAFMETQANMFAGFLLMPTDLLSSKFEAEKQAIAKHPDFKNRRVPDDKTIAPFIAKNIAKTFGVSEEAAANRLSNWLDSIEK